jgi:hypothetical protein
MPSPFPGMDPYLERTSGWHPFHTWLVTSLAEELNRVLPERYYASAETRMVRTVLDDSLLVGTADTAVLSRGTRDSAAGGSGVGTAGVEVLVPLSETERERYIEVCDADLGGEVVVAVEVLSPSNKRPGVGREQYLEKRNVILGSLVHLVEIDLLRRGQRMPVASAPDGYAYSILVSRVGVRPRARLLPFGIRDRFPNFVLPLQLPEEEPQVDLRAALDHVYESGRYAQRIDYTRSPEPPLSGEDEAWADALLREKGLR